MLLYKTLIALGELIVAHAEVDVADIVRLQQLCSYALVALSAGILYCVSAQTEVCETPYEVISKDPTLSLVKGAIDAAGLKGMGLRSLKWTNAKDRLEGQITIFRSSMNSE